MGTQHLLCPDGTCTLLLNPLREGTLQGLPLVLADGWPRALAASIAPSLISLHKITTTQTSSTTASFASFELHIRASCSLYSPVPGFPHSTFYV